MKMLQQHARKFYSAIILILLLSVLPQSWCAELYGPLVGSWVSTERSKGGIRNVHYYGENGTFASKLSVMIGYFYKLTDDKLVLTPASADEGESLEYTIVLEGNSLTLKSAAEANTRVLQREPEKGSNTEQPGLLGTWTFTYHNKTTGYYTFRPDGRLLFQVPFPGDVIRQYSVEGNEIVLKDKTAVEHIKFSIQGDTLTLVSADGKKEHTYRKAKAIE